MQTTLTVYVSLYQQQAISAQLLKTLVVKAYSCFNDCFLLLAFCKMVVMNVMNVI